MSSVSRNQVRLREAEIVDEIKVIEMVLNCKQLQFFPIRCFVFSWLFVIYGVVSIRMDREKRQRECVCKSVSISSCKQF